MSTRSTGAAAQGFTALPQVTGYTATSGRFRLSSTGFVRCSADEERLCFDASGNFTGQYIQGADTYYSAPWDDTAAPHTSSDPAYLTTSAGGTIAYAGAHSEADIFGTTGKGVVITQTSTQNGFHTANNCSVSVVSGDLVRVHAIVAISASTITGRVQLRTISSGSVEFNHDASGVITGFTENWTTYRAGYHDMGTINGKRWWYVWADRKATSTTTARVGIGFGNVTADAGKKFHVCELMIQKNPATAPAAIPVCAASKTFAADTLATSLSNVGYVCEGLALARSQTPSGNITAPAVSIGVPYEPLETRIAIILSIESADRSGPMPNENVLYYGRPWGTPTTHALTFGPGWFPRDWYKASATSEAATNLTVRSVFQATEAYHAILGNMTTSSTYVTGAIDIDRVALMAGGDTRTKYIEQSDVLAGTGASFYFVAGTNLSVTNSLVMGSTLHPTRSRYAVQADETDAKRVYMGEMVLQSNSGGAISLEGTRTHNLARTALTATSNSTSVSYNTDDFCATGFWSDMLYVTRGTVTSWTGDRMFGALTTALNDMFLCQTERQIRISTDAGANWANLSTSFDPADLPHGFLAEHIGTWDFDTLAFTAAPDATKTCRVRYWQRGSSNYDDKPAFQWVGSQMDMGTHSRLPDDGDVFRIKNGDTWIDVTYQGGYWSGGSYTRASTPANLTHLVSNDFVQVNRQFVTMTTANTFDGCVFLGSKGGFFLTGNVAMGATDSAIDNVTISNLVVLSVGTNGLRFDYSRVASSQVDLSNALFIEAASDFTYTDGKGYTLTIGAAGANNTLALGANVTVMSSKVGGGLEAAQAGATYTGSLTTIVPGVRSAYDTFSTPDAKVPQYFPTEFYDSTQGRAKLPATGREFDFDLTAFADSDAGFTARAVIAAAKGTHARWNSVIADIKAKWHKTPDAVAVTANSASVDTSLATGLSGTGFDTTKGGNHDGYFKIEGGALKVAKALTGLNRVQMLRTDADELLVVDVTT
ncbi:MAG: hypothetical protein GC147_04245 [Porphyrobacter sp.]|nr:hypothetical protein [Porphyrobacter sp.]